MNALNMHQHSSEHSLDHHQLISTNQATKTINQLEPINPLFQHNPPTDQLGLSSSFISSPSLNSPASSATTTILNSSASSSNSSKPSTAHLTHLNLNHPIPFSSSSTTTPPPPSQIKRKFNATLEQKILILDWHHANGKKQTKTAAHFTALDGWPTITQPLISNWLKDEEKIRANLKLATPDTKRLRIIRHPDVEQALSIWCNQAIAQNIQLGYEPIRSQARQFAVALGIDEAEFTRSSTSWIDRFLERQGTRTIKTHNSDNLSPNAVEAERVRIRALSAYYPLQDIWSFDETSLYYTMPPDLSIPTEKWSSDQQLLTFALAVNADSSERRPPTIIGHSQAPRSLNGKLPESLGFDYGWNPKACVTPEMFIRLMLGWQKELAKQNRKILLLIDNNPGHIVESDLYPNIRIEFISSNMSAFLQPLDQGIIRVWKANYRRLFLRRALELHEANQANVYEIDQLEAMHLANTAWSSCVPNSTVLSCWRRTDLLISDAHAFDLLLPPDVGDQGVGLAEAELAKTIDLLVERGLLNASNRIALEEYSDPACERIVTLQKFTDAEIIALVRNEDGRRVEVTRHHDEECKEEPDKALNSVQMSRAASNGLARAVHRPAQQAGSHLQHFHPPPARNLVLPHPMHTAHLGSSGELSSLANEQVKTEELNEEPAQGGNPSVWTVPQVLEAFEEIGRFSMMRRGETEWAELLHVMAKASQRLRSEWESGGAGLGGQTAGQVQVQTQTRPGPHPLLHAHPSHGQLAGPPSRRQGSLGSLGQPITQPRPQSQPHQIAHSQPQHHAPPHAHPLPHAHHHTQLHYQQTAGVGPRPQSALPHASMGFHRQQHHTHLSQLSPQGHQVQHHLAQQQQHRSSPAQQHQHHLQQQQAQQSPSQQSNHHSPAQQTNHHGSPLQTNHQAHLQAEQSQQQQQQQEQLQQAQTPQQQTHTQQYQEPPQSQTPQQQQTPQHQQPHQAQQSQPQSLQTQTQQPNHHHHHQHHQHHQPATGHSQLSIDAITHPVNVNSN